MHINPFPTINPFGTAASTGSASGTAGATTGATASTTTSAASSNATPGLQSMFMQLLTAQLENQSPLDPVDPTQFTSQLVQFNMLDQLTQINSTLQSSLASPSTARASNNSVQGAN